jgi:hypothetical protein
MRGHIRMALKEMGVSTRNWVESAQGRDHWRAIVNVAFELPGFINHGIS